MMWNGLKRLTAECKGEYVPHEMLIINIEGRVYGRKTCVAVCEKFADEESCGSCPIQRAFNRLAEYENLEITPDQIKELDKKYTEKCSQVKEIVKRLEKEAEEARAVGESDGLLKAIEIVKSGGIGKEKEETE